MYSPEERYRLLLIELNQLDISEINDIIDSCNLVMNSTHDELYWGWHISSLDMRKEITHLSYNNSFVAEIPTVEILNMLKEYRDRLLEFEYEQKRSL
jgi:hypothetical protein